jgi:hypothetical protein
MSKSVNFVKIVSPIALAIALSACGGSSGSEFGSGGTGTTTTDTSGTTGTDTTDIVASSLSVSASSRQLFSSGSEPVTISALAKDANNNIISGATVNFSVDSDANLITGDNTGSVHTAELTPGSKENRSLTVTVSSGTQSETILIDVVGTEINVEGPSSIAINKPTEYTIKLQDSDDKAIAFEDIEVTSALGNTVTPVSGTNFSTDSNGEFKVSLTAAAGGSDVITASALSSTTSKSIEISGSDFTLTGTDLNNDGSIDAADRELNIGTSEVITIKWSINGVNQAGKTISVRTTRGTLNNSTVTTDSSGVATFQVSSNTAGSATITAESNTGLVATLDREFVAITPEYLNTQASPSLISANKTSRIITKVRDVNDNPVKNIKVNFNLTDTVNGTLSNSQAVTDSLGRAEVVYAAGDSPSSYEGVKIDTYIQDNPAIIDSVNLTVRGDASRIVLGSDELIAEDGIFYSKTFGVIVTDSAGNPIPDQKVDFTIAANTYLKGQMNLVDTSNPADGEADRWARFATIECPIEDFDRDGNLDNGEDINGNGTLEPTQDATITTTGVTDAEGKMTVQVIYPQSRALWSTQLITAKTVVNGTEFVENTTYGMDILLADVEDPESSVPNQLSPYGLNGSCSDPD